MIEGDWSSDVCSSDLFLLFHDFQFSCHIPRPTVDISKFSTFFSFPRHISPPKVCISHFPWFSVFSPYSRSYSVYFSFFKFFSDIIIIFHVLKCVFLIFRDFQFYPHIPGPSVGISHFSRFLLISSFFKSSSLCFSFSMIYIFLPYSTSYSGHS